LIALSNMNYKFTIYQEEYMVSADQTARHRSQTDSLARQRSNKCTVRADQPARDNPRLTSCQTEEACGQRHSTSQARTTNVLSVKTSEQETRDQQRSTFYARCRNSRPVKGNKTCAVSTIRPSRKESQAYVLSEEQQAYGRC
jgi:hypothetical protein